MKVSDRYVMLYSFYIALYNPYQIWKNPVRRRLTFCRLAYVFKLRVLRDFVKVSGVVWWGILCFFRFIWAVMIEKICRGIGQFPSAQELKEKQVSVCEGLDQNMIRECIMSKNNGFRDRLKTVEKNKGSQIEHDFQKVWKVHRIVAVEMTVPFALLSQHLIFPNW